VGSVQGWYLPLMPDEDAPPAPVGPPLEPPAPQRREPLLDRAGKAPATFSICAINVLVFLFVETHGGSTSVVNLVRFGALERSHVWAGEYWRFVTPMFLHIGWMHILWNTYCMVGWCSAVERALGRRRFVIAYLVTGIGACATSLLCHDAPGAAGASGAAFGIVGITFALRWRVLGGWNAFVADPWIRRTAGILVVWTIIGWNTFDNFAHGGGLLTGAVMGALFVREPSLAVPRRILEWSAFAVVMGLLLAAAAHRWPGERSVWQAYEALRAPQDGG
jgi:rhomboid protease GluP